MRSGTKTGGSMRINRDAVPDWIKTSDSRQYLFDGLAADVLAGGKRRLSAMAGFAVEHLRDELTGAERTELSDSDARATRRAMSRVHFEIGRAFEAQDPTAKQLRLRERAWDSSPYKLVFPTLNVATMRFAGERSSGLASREDRERRRRLQDDRDFWTPDRDCGFSLRELRKTTPAHKILRNAIIDGATRYGNEWLTRAQASSFERWFIGSRDFRLFTIPYLATAHMRAARDLHVRWREVHGPLPTAPSRKAVNALRVALACFRFEQSTARELADAKRIWAENAETLPLPTVDLFTAEVTRGR